MNPFLSSGIILMLRWLQFIASRELLGTFPEQARILSNLLEETSIYTGRLSEYTLNSNDMSDKPTPTKLM